MSQQTLQQIRNQVWNKLQESSTDSHFDQSTLNGYINEAIDFMAIWIEFPRDIISVAAVQGTADYTLPSDNVLIKTAYFGDITTPGDVTDLDVVSEETLKSMFPNWLETTTKSQGTPKFLMLKDRYTITIFPTPNAAAAGKKIFLNYIYDPAALSSDSDVPDLPVPYQSLVQFYALHLAYIYLKDATRSKQMFDDFMTKMKLIKSAVTKESKEQISFMWGSDVDVDSNSGNLDFYG